MQVPWRKPPLEHLVALLVRHGLDSYAQNLSSLGLELEESMQRASWFSRNSKRIKAVLTRHAENAAVEWRETTHLLQVARQLLVERQTVAPADLDMARSQFLDLLKTVPASAIVAGTFLIPVPGAQPILAPVLMERLGLLPSAWSESRLESELRDLVRLAGERGLTDLRREGERALEEVRRHRDQLHGLRRYVEENPDWAIFFDENLDSRISPSEIGALRDRVMRAARAAAADPDASVWSVYFRGDAHEDKVLTGLSFAQVRSGFPDVQNALIRRGDSDWWVPLYAVLDELGW